MKSCVCNNRLIRVEINSRAIMDLYTICKIRQLIDSVGDETVALFFIRETIGKHDIVEGPL